MHTKIGKGLKNPPAAMRYIHRKYRSWRLRKWYEKVAIPAEDYFKKIDADLWDESVEFTVDFHKSIQNEFEGLEVDPLNEESGVGGAAGLELLYFYVRHTQPEIVLETGVAAGYSSHTVLRALEKNGHGELYSNDLPYSERPSKEGKVVLDKDDIGTLVPDELRSRWHLNLGPDKENLPEIVESVESIDLFHYDSDKSYSGRKFGIETVKPKLHDNSTVIMDDITDNKFFKDFVQLEQLDWCVLDPPQNELTGIVNGQYHRIVD